jgi:hypothetical protein
MDEEGWEEDKGYDEGYAFEYCDIKRCSELPNPCPDCPYQEDI